MDNILINIRKALIDNIDEKTKATAQNFFKEKIKYLGVKVPLVNKISKDIFKEIKNSKKEDIFMLCEKLWQSGYSEESYIACNLSYYMCEQYTPEDFNMFERWVNEYVNNWASCDTLCNHSIGAFMEMYPAYTAELKKWAKSENRWVKRASAVTLIIPARKGLFLDDIFDIADSLLLDKDDLVQKGYGWMLKAASEANRQEVFDYVISKRAVMPRTAFRYALEKMPEEMRTIAMNKDI